MFRDVVTIFEKVRNLPFHCPESLKDVDYRCWGKHRTLYSELKKQGYEVRFRVCQFKWSETGIPKDILAFVSLDLDLHLFLEIKINNNWIVLDCTYDSKLPNFNEWDGKSNCKLAVKSIRTYSPKGSQKLEQLETKRFKKEFAKYKLFYIKFNRFLEDLRQKNTSHNRFLGL